MFVHDEAAAFECWNAIGGPLRPLLFAQVPPQAFRPKVSFSSELVSTHLGRRSAELVDERCCSVSSGQFKGLQGRFDRMEAGVNQL